MRLSTHCTLAMAVLSAICITAFADSPVRVLKAPVLGSLVIGTDVAEAKADVAKLAGFFASVRESTSVTPECDVLFLYANVDTDGTLRGAKQTLKSVIHESRAAIVVIASENPSDNYLKLGKSEPHKGIILVMTIERKGHTFPKFFEALFSRMSLGSDMLSAWIQLAPQYKDAPKVIDAPETIAVVDTGTITFAKR